MHLLINPCHMQHCGSSNNVDEEREVVSSADTEGTLLQCQQDFAPKGKAGTYAAVLVCFFLTFVLRLVV
jgi:hypothetical protein